MAIPTSTLTAETLAEMMKAAVDYMPRFDSVFASKGALTGLVKLRQDAAPSLFEQDLLSRGGGLTFMGIDVIQADIPKRKVFDWSGCRSPARAKRRHAQGHPQRVKVTEEDVVYLVDKSRLDLLGRLEAISVRAIMGDFTS